MLKGGALKKNKEDKEDYCEAVLLIDGKEMQAARLPTDEIKRRDGLFWNYQLPKGKHHITIKSRKAKEGYEIYSTEYIIYSDQPGIGLNKN